MDSLNSLIAELDEHSRDAEKRFHALPRPVRFKLTAETRSMFQKYAQHGSQARLRHNIKGFLEKGDEGTKLSEISTSKTSDNSATSQPDRRIGQTRSSQRGTKLEGSCVAESRTVDMDSTELIPPPPDGLEFHLDRSFVLNADTTIPQDLLESMDRVFGLYAKQAKLFLGHHCEKYGNEAVFRSGIREWVMSRTDTLFQSINQHDLGLTPETEEFLFSVYERHPDLNVAETRMMVRATRLDEDTIEFFWDDMTERRKSYLAMRQFIAARELRQLRSEGE